MKVQAKELNRIQLKEQTNSNKDLNMLNSCQVLNEIANNHSSCYRLSPGAKRLIVLRALDECHTPRDTALLIRVLNEIDALEDKSNGGLRDTNITYTWAAAASDADVIKDN